MKVTTNRPIFHRGKVTSEIETTEQHARELQSRGLISTEMTPASEIPKAAAVKPKVRHGK